MKVGIIGLGNMGLPIAENILNNGYELVVYNRTTSKANPLVQKGAILAKTPYEVAQKTNFVFTILSDDEATRQTVFGETGILAGLSEDGIHVSMGTISVSCAKEMTKEYSEQGKAFASATVLGRPDAAAAGKLSVILAGNSEACKKIKPIVSTFGKQTFEVGEEAYLANIAKLGNNFLLVSMLESLAEVFTLIEKYDLDKKQFLQIFNSLFQSPVYQNYSTLMIEEDFQPAGFDMRLGLKDTNLVSAAAEQVSAELPIADLAKNHFQMSIEAGLDDWDWSALIKTMRSLNE